MRNPNLKEFAKKSLVLLLFVMFGFCMPGFAAPKTNAHVGRSGS
jgi:hypothetical protein